MFYFIKKRGPEILNRLVGYSVNERMEAERERYEGGGECRAIDWTDRASRRA